VNVFEEQYIALPKLYGAPPYARPPRLYEQIDRPPDPDDLPLEAFRAEDDMGVGPAVAGSPAGGSEAVLAEPQGRGQPEPGLQPRSFSVRALGRFLSGR
jgi:hypothetical protein